MSDLARAAFAATLDDFQQAAERIVNDTIITPALPFGRPDRDIYLKAECLQPLGSFKSRATANAIAMASADQLANGVVTASAGNFGQGIAKAAQARNLSAHVIAPDSAAKVKIEALQGFGASVETVSFEDWWQVIMTRETGRDGFFIHPVAELSVILGNGSMGLEIATQVPDVDTIVVPVGGGGMISGIALALKALGRNVKIIAAEIESSTPILKAREAGKPVDVPRGPSWIDGIGSTGVLGEMWPLLENLVDDVIVVSHSEAASALRALTTQAHIVAEGAGAVAVAAALHPSLAGRVVVPIVSGGNIDPETHARILLGSDI